MNQRELPQLIFLHAVGLSQTPDRNAKHTATKKCVENQFFTLQLILYFIEFNSRFNAKVFVASWLECCHWECRSFYNCYESSPIDPFESSILQPVRCRSSSTISIIYIWDTLRGALEHTQQVYQVQIHSSLMYTRFNRSIKRFFLPYLVNIELE